QIELLLRPESEHVGFDDLGLGEWVFDVPTVFLSTRQPFQDAVTFVMAHPYDLGEGAGRIPVRIHEGEHRLNLEILCAPALLPIRRALLLCHESFEGFAVAARGIESHFLETGLGIPPFQPVDADAPLRSALMHKAQRFLTLLTRAGKADMYIFGESDIMSATAFMEHIAACTAAAE